MVLYRETGIENSFRLPTPEKGGKISLCLSMYAIAMKKSTLKNCWFAYANSHSMPITVLGGMTNSLISDQGIEGLTILTTHLARRHVQGEMFCVRTGLALDRAIDFALEAGLSGLELLGGIPGSVGGAIYGNAGANGMAIGTLLYYVDYMTFDGKLHRKQTHCDEFSYRYSPFTGRKDVILYEAGFRLNPTLHTSEARKIKDKVKQKRKENGHDKQQTLQRHHQQQWQGDFKRCPRLAQFHAKRGTQKDRHSSMSRNPAHRSLVTAYSKARETALPILFFSFHVPIPLPMATESLRVITYPASV
jgi:UDP-N-acetylenolpyruvoylglucosamine reductase